MKTKQFKLKAFAFLATCWLSSSAAYAQYPINPAQNADFEIGPNYFFDTHSLESDLIKSTELGGANLLAFAFDGDGSNQWTSLKAGILLTDDTYNINGTTDYYAFENLVSFGYIPNYANLEFKHPDLTLLEEGKKLLTTFEVYDNGNLQNSYLAEFDIIYNNLSYTLSIVNVRRLNSSTISSEPRIDGDHVLNTAAVTCIQFGQPYYSIYTNNGSYYHNTIVANMKAYDAFNPIVYNAIHPDIAIGHDLNNDIQVVSSYVDAEFGQSQSAISEIRVNYFFNLNNYPSQIAAYPISNLGIDLAYTSNSGDINYPHICNRQSTTSYTNPGMMNWALTASFIDLNNPIPIPTPGSPSGGRLIYIAATDPQIPFPSNYSVLDYGLLAGGYQQNFAAVDWAKGGGVVAWRNEDSPLGNTQTLACVEPTFNNPQWNQVFSNYTYGGLSGSGCEVQAVSVASTEDDYMISEIFCGKLIYKINSVNSSSFKPSQISHATKIYPNPASSILNIDVENDCQIELTDIFGKIVISKLLSKGTNMISTNDLSIGNYVLRFKNNEKSNQLISILR